MQEPQEKLKRDHFITFRLNSAELRKIRELAQKTERTPGEVFRLLLKRAEALDRADIILREVEDG